ncbi:MAG: zinc-binding dehydrogenase, partial [Chitinophagales bacterium]
LDGVGKTTFIKCKKLLKKKGVFSSSNGMINLLWVLITAIFGGKKVAFPAGTTVKAGLSFIKDLIEKGSFRPVIDRKYPLDKIAEAYKYVASGQKIGNVIITMDA